MNGCWFVSLKPVRLSPYNLARIEGLFIFGVERQREPKNFIPALRIPISRRRAVPEVAARPTCYSPSPASPPLSTRWRIPPRRVVFRSAYNLCALLTLVLVSLACDAIGPLGVGGCSSAARWPIAPSPACPSASSCHRASGPTSSSGTGSRPCAVSWRTRARE